MGREVASVEMRTARQYLISPHVSPGAEVGRASPPMCFGVGCCTCVCKFRNRLLILALGRFGAAGLDLCSECQAGLG